LKDTGRMVKVLVSVYISKTHALTTNNVHDPLYAVFFGFLERQNDEQF